MLKKIAPFSLWIALFFVVIGMVLLGYLPGHASENRTVEFSWEYPTTIADLAGFRMYMGGVAFPIPDPKMRTVQHLYPTISDTSACFAMTAIDAKGNESAKSPETCLDPPPPPPAVLRAVMAPIKAAAGATAAPATIK